MTDVSPLLHEAEDDADGGGAEKRREDHDAAVHLEPRPRA